MKIKMEVEIQPFDVPDHVREVGQVGLKQDGAQQLARYPLSALDSLTLDRMCDEFRTAVFAKAGKQMPPTCC